ncbi:MAG: hypothetical protein K6C14_01310 [Eubacterium sp.]|nr:hypothetical protein [Eubacterium sp.]
MAKKDYFEDDGNIETKKTVADSIKPVFSSLLTRINEQKALQEKEEAEKRKADGQRHLAPAFPEDILELINADASDVTADIVKQVKAENSEKSVIMEEPQEAEEPITVSSSAERAEHEEESEALVDAIRAFSHKSGDAITSVAHSIKKNTIAVAAVIEEKEKSSSKLHKAFVIFIMMIITVLIFAGFIAVFMHQMTAENERISLFSTEAGKVCTSYVRDYGSPSYENLYTTYGVDGCRLTGICFVRELDFDDDGTSELMLTYNKNGVYYNEVWGFNDKDEFAPLFSEKAAQSSNKAKDAYSTLYRKNNKYYIGIHEEKKLNKIELYQLKGDKFVKRYDCTYDPKTQAYEVDGKDDTTAFERIKYSVFKSEKASAEAEKTAVMIEGYSGKSDVAEISNKQSRKNAYYSIVQDYNKRFGTAELAEEGGVAFIKGLAVVDLIDFDGDGKNELLLVYRKPIKVRNEAAEGYASYEVDTYYCEIFRYTGAKAVLAYTSEGLSNMPDGGNDRYYVIMKDGKQHYYCANSFKNTDYGRHTSATSSMFKFDKTSFQPIYSASYESEYGYTEYYLDGEEVSTSAFEEDGYRVALFDGEEKSYDKDTFKVVYVQRSAKNKSSIESRVSDTVKTIQKLNPAYSAD